MEKFNPFRLDASLPVPLPGIGAKPIRLGIEKLLGLDDMAQAYASLSPSDAPEDFTGKIARHFNISHKIIHGGLSQIPECGPVVVLANHPFGGIEGVLLLSLLLKRRKDVRVMANSVLKRIPELSSSFIGVNPYATKNAVRQNFSAMREALCWLKSQGLLLVFPAGDVAALQFRNMRIAEGKWDAGIIRLARLGSASIVPLFVAGRNSLYFNLLGKIHPRIRTLLLPREFLNKSGRQIGLSIGSALSPARLRRIGDDDETARYLRLKTSMLASAGNPARTDDNAVSRISHIPISEPRPANILCDEIAALPQEHKLAASRDMAVYYARAAQIPALLHQIGIEREIAFRASGEGTGKTRDLDPYDAYYLHLFIWNHHEKELVGAYRLGLGDEIMRSHGRKGFYSHSLFRFKDALVKTLNPAIELGRSFICTKYQKNPASMMLLWKGIGAFLTRHPRYTTLFGPVSISNEYSALSRQLMVECFRANNNDDPLLKHIKPRNRYQPRLKAAWRKSDLVGLGSIEGISELVSSIENDGKGVPVLIRHYVKFGGRMLAFNVDNDFSSCIDALIVVDLPNASRHILKRYMGREGAENFLAYHAQAARVLTS